MTTEQVHSISLVFFGFTLVWNFVAIGMCLKRITRVNEALKSVSEDYETIQKSIDDVKTIPEQVSQSATQIQQWLIGEHAQMRTYIQGIAQGLTSRKQE